MGHNFLHKLRIFLSRRVLLQVNFGAYFLRHSLHVLSSIQFLNQR